MSEPLDPYRKWLGIRDPGRPPNHYRLLGLELFEEDRETIANAADRQMGHVRNYQVGPYAALSQRLLNELAAAKLCLLDRAKKTAYDAALRRQVEPREKAANKSAELLPNIVIDSPTQPRRSVGRRPSLWLPVVGLCGTLAVVLATAYWLLTSENAEELPEPVVPAPALQPLATPVPRKPARNESARLPALPDRMSSRDGAKVEAPVEDRPRVHEPVSIEPQAPRNLEADVAYVRNALAMRQLAEAAGRLEALDSTGLNAEQRQELGPLQTLHDLLAEFWQKSQVGVDALRPGDELIVDETPYSVADLQGENLILQSRTQRIQFDRSLLPRLQDLPFGFVVAFAERGYVPGDPRAKLAIGAFLAFDRYGAPEQARRYWEEAARSGLVVADLLAEWDAMRRDIPAAETMANQGTDLKRNEVPTEEARQAAARKIEELHGAAYAAARTAEEKQKLADELLRQGLETRDATGARYVLLDEARSLALAGDDVELALRASRELGRDYEVDELDLQYATLEGALKSSRDAMPCRSVARLANGLVDEAVDQDRFELAKELNQLALTAARGLATVSWRADGGRGASRAGNRTALPLRPARRRKPC